MRWRRECVGNAEASRRERKWPEELRPDGLRRRRRCQARTTQARTTQKTERPKTRTTTRGSRALARVTHGRLRSADTPRTNPRRHPTASSRYSRDALDTSGDVERDRRTARAGLWMHRNGSKSAQCIHLRRAARRARAGSKMRPLRPHRSSPARTVLPLDGSRGVESPGDESMGHAVRSHTGQTTLTGTHPTEATNASEGIRKISLPRRKVNQARWLRHGAPGGSTSTRQRTSELEPVLSRFPVRR